MTIQVLTGQDPFRLKSLRLSALKDTPDAFGAKHEDELLLSDTHWQERMVNTQWCFVVADGVDIGLLAVDRADKERYARAPHQLRQDISTNVIGAKQITLLHISNS